MNNKSIIDSRVINNAQNFGMNNTKGISDYTTYNAQLGHTQTLLIKWLLTSLCEAHHIILSIE